MSALIRVVLSQKELQIEPGQKGELSVTIQNLSEIIDQYSIEIDGLDPGWYTIPVSEVSLFPQDQKRVRVLLHPPSGPAGKAGKYDFMVRVTSREIPTERTSVPATLEILPILSLELGLSPQRISTIKEGVFRVRLANPGNVDLTVNLEATDPEEGCRYRFKPQRVSISAGQSKGVSLIVAPKRKHLMGAARCYDFTVKAIPITAPAKAKAVVGQLEHRALMPRWVVPVAIIALLFLCCGVAAWIINCIRKAEDIEEFISCIKGTLMPCAPPPGWLPYTVQPGDTLYSLAKHCRTTVDAIMQANCLRDPDIRVGQRLYLPCLPPTPTPTFTPTPTPTPTFTPTPPVIFPPPPPILILTPLPPIPILTPNGRVLNQANFTLYSTGPATICGTCTFDLDEGVVSPPSADKDLWWEIAAPGERYLVPQNRALLTVFGTTVPSYYDCKQAPLSTAKISDEQIPIGTYICARTNEGRYAVFRINDDDGYNLHICYATWDVE